MVYINTEASLTVVVTLMQKYTVNFNGWLAFTDKRAPDLHLKILLPSLLGVGRPESTLKQLVEILMLCLLQATAVTYLKLALYMSTVFQLLALLLYAKWYHVLFQALCWHNCVALRQFRHDVQHLSAVHENTIAGERSRFFYCSNSENL